MKQLPGAGGRITPIEGKSFVFVRGRLSYIEIPLIIESIYESEIPCRIEWVFDGGFTWSIQGGNYPRLWKDDAIDGNISILCESTDNMILRNNPLLEKDWIARGSDYSFADAIQQLADKIVELFPNCNLSKWYNSSGRYNK